VYVPGVLKVTEYVEFAALMTALLVKLGEPVD
jgi:hypothetical protein